MKIVDDPLDPVFVTAGLSLGRVELQIGEGSGARYSRLSPGEARRVAQAILKAVQDLDAGNRQP